MTTIYALIAAHADAFARLEAASDAAGDCNSPILENALDAADRVENDAFRELLSFPTPDARSAKFKASYLWHCRTMGREIQVDEVTELLRSFLTAELEAA